MAYDDTVEKDTAKEAGSRRASRNPERGLLHRSQGEPPETLREGCYIGAKGRQNSKKKS